ncbi:MAG: WecB/TagA/CpsF family glycosyltransferase [Thermosynechococcaceae cyanobacterium]
MNVQSSINIIGSPITALSFRRQIEVIVDWAKIHSSRYVCVANTHMLVEAYKHSGFWSVLQSADLVTPDGMPLVWMMKLLGLRCQERVAGMDILFALCKEASTQGLSVFFAGSQQYVLTQMKARLSVEFPDLDIVGMEPLPFGSSVPEENEALIRQINESGAGLVFVALGCPKQEYWMSRHKHKVKAVMIGLGGVFPVYAGIQKHAPRIMRQAGLEWLYRLLQEPKRLWHRYASTIPLFIYLAAQQLYAEFDIKHRMSQLFHKNVSLRG